MAKKSCSMLFAVLLAITHGVTQPNKPAAEALIEKIVQRMTVKLTYQASM